MKNAGDKLAADLKNLKVKYLFVYIAGMCTIEGNAGTLAATGTTTPHTIVLCAPTDFTDLRRATCTLKEPGTVKEPGTNY